jgi:hypothetical protein
MFMTFSRSMNSPVNAAYAIMLSTYSNTPVVLKAGEIIDLYLDDGTTVKLTNLFSSELESAKPVRGDSYFMTYSICSAQDFRKLATRTIRRIRIGIDPGVIEVPVRNDGVARQIRNCMASFLTQS